MADRISKSTPTKRFSTDPKSVLVDHIREELQWAGDRSLVAGKTAAAKKNYAEGLSRALAQRFADALRSPFEGVLPARDGSGQES
jgi:hypothetical protein